MQLDELRSLRRRVRALHQTAVDDLLPYRVAGSNTFRRLPRVDSLEVSVTTTCTALMTLALMQRTDELYGKGDGAVSTFHAFQELMDVKWTSSGLDPDNAFTCSLVLRTAGHLAACNIAAKSDLLALNHKKQPKKAASPARDLGAIAVQLATGAPDRFRVNGSSPPITLAYWLIDAADCLSLDLGSGWTKLSLWASRIFSRQVSLIVSHHDALMDPSAMLMSACALARLRRRAEALAGGSSIPLEQLPTFVELRDGVRSFLGRQAESGIWPKYFPLFHYPKEGSNYTFSFELLEALIVEFGHSDLLTEADAIDHIARAVRWCETNRLILRSGQTYEGWNSGGQLSTLERGEPESWATGTVHMFLHELDYALSCAIDRGILARYTPGAVRGRKRSTQRFDRILDTDIVISGEVRSLLEVVKSEMMAGVSPDNRRHVKLPRLRSALLFGPPGTSKTTLVRAFAEYVGWPYIELNPSDFLSKGLDRIYERAEEIFADLYDVRGAVVLFDEMDALVRRRPSDGSEPPLDIAREFLTTTMLPKLARLHEHENAVYFMATNHRQFFDDAVIRPGRFDLHLFMGMPTWTTKLEHLSAFVSGSMSSADEAYCRDELGTWCPPGSAIAAKLDLFSFGELRSLIEQYSHGDALTDTINAVDARKRWIELASQHAEQFIALRPRRGAVKNPLLIEYQKDLTQSRMQ